MTEKYKLANIAKSSGEIKISLTKEQYDSDGELVMVDGIDLERFKTNPILLWAHRSWNPDIEDVVGNLSDIKKEKDADGVMMLTAIVNFADHPKAQYLKRMVEKGIVKGISMGFRVNDGGYDAETRVINKSELFEVSFVPVQANTGATVLSKGAKHVIDTVNEIDKMGGAKEEIYKNLATLSDIHPKIKSYRKTIQSDEIFKALEIEKTGNELTDIKNIYEKVLSIPNIIASFETQMKQLTKPETPQVNETKKVSKEELIKILTS